MRHHVSDHQKENDQGEEYTRLKADLIFGLERYEEPEEWHEKYEDAGNLKVQNIKETAATELENNAGDVWMNRFVENIFHVPFLQTIVEIRSPAVAVIADRTANDQLVNHHLDNTTPMFEST